MMKKLLLLHLVLMILVALPQRADAELKVVTTLAGLGWLAERVGGPDVQVTVLCPGHQDPHYLPAKPSLARKLRDADLLAYNGLELEIGWLPLLIESARNPKLKAGSPGELDCSQAVRQILEIPTGPVDRSQGDIHPLGNPHYLLDPRNGAAVARLMAERLGELDVERAASYRRRADDLAADIESRIPGWQARVRAVRSCPVIVYHVHWSYLLDWLELRQIGTIEHRPGITPSPRHVEQVIRLAKAQDCVTVIAAPWDHLDVAKRAAERMNAPMVVLPSAAGSQDGVMTYFEIFDVICSRLAAAGAAQQ